MEVLPGASAGDGAARFHGESLDDGESLSVDVR